MEGERSENILKRGYNKVRSFFSSNNNDQMQLDKQINLQELTLLQDQDNRNFTLGGLLSCLETIAFKESNSPNNFIKKYDGYNPKSVQDKKELEQLIIQLRIQSKAFHNMYQEFTNDGQDYWFPDNLSREEIINDIGKWRVKVRADFRQYYDNIIYLLKGEEERIKYPKLKFNKKDGEKASCSPRKQLKIIPPNISYINLRRKIVKINYLRDKPFDNTLRLYAKEHCDSAFEKINQRYKKAIEQHEDSCNCDVCIGTIEIFNNY